MQIKCEYSGHFEKETSLFYTLERHLLAVKIEIFPFSWKRRVSSPISLRTALALMSTFTQNNSFDNLDDKKPKGVYHEGKDRQAVPVRYLK